MEKPSPAQRHILFELSPLDAEQEEIEEKTRRCYNNVKQMIAGKAPKECQEIYLKHIAANVQLNTEELTMGLLVAILVEQEGQSDYYRDIATFSKDNLNLFSTYLNMIIIERITRISDHATKRIFWISDQLMKAGTNAAENTCSNLIRQTAGGDLSTRNLSMVENLIDLLSDNRTWLINSTSFMGPTVIYNLMRLIVDHAGPAHSALRQREVDFVIGLIREKFDFVLGVGKDFLRLLNNVNRIPEFEKLSHDLYHNPKLLHPKYEGPHQLLALRTPRRLFQSRLTFDMERKFSFLATHVKFGAQKRYQEWFHKQYLSTPESLSLRCDLIRYICTIIHPSNEVLCSDIIPRWAIIGWLLTTCTTTTSAANSKHALFFDWFAFEAKTDNIMNIEPAILVMYYSLRSHSSVTASLIDHLCRAPTIFPPKLSEHVRIGIKKSLQQILEKRVVQTLSPIFDSNKYDASLKASIRENFPEFCAGGHADNGISTLPVTMPATIGEPNSLPEIIGTNPCNDSKQPDVIVLDDKCMTPPSDIAMGVTEPKINKIQQDSNHIGGRNTEQSSGPGNGSQKKRLPPARPQVPAAATVKLESKVPTWNGTDNETANVAKLNHDNNKDKKTYTLPQESIVDNLTKRNKGTIIGVSANSDMINNISDDVDFLSDTSPSTSPAPVPAVGPAEEPANDNSVTKVIYPFMTVKRIVSKETIKSFDESISSVLEDLSTERSNELRCSLMDKLISAMLEVQELSTNQSMLDDLGSCVAHLISDDFTTRIFPSSSQDFEILEESIATPFFILCRSAFTISKINQKPLALLAAMSKFFDATGFLVLYFLRIQCIGGGAALSTNYLAYCEAAQRKPLKCLYDDLRMAATYDSEMFCFLLPSIFGELGSNVAFPVTNNSDLIHLVVSAIDPVYLQDLICLCMTGSTRIIDREDPLPVIETSLNWESLEQYCFWKIVAAQTVPIENYISILPRLDAKANPEAISCIMLNLQKISQPSPSFIQYVFDSISKQNDIFVASMIRYWSIKTDIKELAKNIKSLYDSRPSSPQVKRKGQVKAVMKSPSSLSCQGEKILQCLNSVRLKAPRNKLFVQAEILDMLTSMESQCNDNQKKKYANLFAMRPKTTKKKKLDKEATT